MFRQISLLLLCIVLVYTDALKKPVNILKCCADSQDLHVTKENDFSCVKGSDSTPTIYSPTKQKILSEPPSFWNIKSNSLPDCGSYRMEIVRTENLALGFVLFEDGSMLLTDTNEKIATDKYCYNSNIAIYCTNQTARVKIRKCCGKGALYSDTKDSCISLNVTDYKIRISDDMKLVDGFAPCDSKMIIAGKMHEAELRSDGSLSLNSSSQTQTIVLPQGSYCLEHILENAGGSASIFTCHSHWPTTTTPDSDISVNRDDVRLRLYPAGLLLSAVFLAATLVAGAALPAVHHHALHWRCQTNHVACLLVGDVLLAITQLIGNGVVEGVCVTMAISMHFLFLAAFFWLNTMCFNIWWTFRDLRPGTLEKRQERCRLRLYGVYAWGVPFLITMVATTLDRLPESPEYNFLRPRFGEVTCWFPGNMEILTYFFGPIGVLLFVNLLLFAATARELTCGLWKRELVKSTTERAALGRVCMKLVVVMGVTWIADVLSWAVGGPQALWYITDLINALQGVFIFIVVACQPQVWTAIKRLWCKRQSLAADITGNGNHHSSSSHGLPSYGESVTNHSVSNTTRSVPLETSC